MRTMLITLTLALASSGCASLAGDPHAGHDAAARGGQKPAHCGMHAAQAAHAASSAAGQGTMMMHCGHMQKNGQPVRP